MKKYITLIVMCLAMIGLQAQNVTLRMGSPDKTYIEYNTNKAVGPGADVWYKIIGDQNTPATQDLICHLDSISGGSMTTTVELYGTKFTTEGWTKIGSTITWKATTSDTTILISNATANRYRDYKVLFHVASGDSISVDYVKFKLYHE